MASYADFKSLGEGAQGNSFPLATQSSIFSLTFGELQTSFSGFGKDFGSMNMDELLKNIWTAEETQVQSTSAAVGCGVASAGAEGLQQQGSWTLPRTLSQKTVDQVWKDLYKEECRVGDSCRAEVNFQPPQPTLGEMTLEDFLLKAGFTRDDPQSAASFSNGGFYSAPTSSSSCVNIGFSPCQQPKAQNQNPPLFPKPANVIFSAPVNLSNRPQLPNIAPRSIMIGMADTQVTHNDFGGQNGVTGIASLRNRTAKVPSVKQLEMGERNSAESSPPLAPSSYGLMRARRCNTGVEKVVERRHRRMIKNRESAARSRARKQAYTVELEAEIAKLRELNEELHRKQEEIMEMEKEEVIEKMRLRWGGGKRVCLRRTVTGPW